MFLYKIEIELEDQIAYLILLAADDVQAFEFMESHVARHYVKAPIIKSAAIVEKKRPEVGIGYFIEASMS